jgi:hypothetical protein
VTDIAAQLALLLSRKNFIKKLQNPQTPNLGII